MIINKVLIVDLDEGEAGEYHFKAGANLLVSTDNRQGKSSLIKTMYYGLGLDIKRFPTNWNPTRMIIKLDLHDPKTGENLFVVRRGDLFYVTGVNEALSASEYTRWLSEKLDVDLKLTFKSTKMTTSISRPSALITPFYVDQDQSWSGRLYSSTNEIGMYSDTPKRIFEYILNISDDEEQRAKEKLSRLKAKKGSIQVKRASINEVYMDYLEETFTEPIPVLSNIAEPSKANKESIDNFIKLMNEANRRYAECKAARIKLQRDLDQQRKSAEEYRSILKMLKGDYETIKAVCKHCRSELTEEQIKTRMEISTNILELSFLIDTAEQEIRKLEKKVSDSILQEDASNQEYQRLSSEVESNKELQSIADYVEESSRKKSQDKFASIIQELDGDIGKYDADIKETAKEIRELARKVKDLVQTIEKSYREYVSDLSIVMRGSNVNTIEFNDYRALQSSGVDVNQVYLGLYLTYMRLISDYGRYTLPFCIDSFIKNETTDEGLKAMFEAIEKYLMNLRGQSIFSAIETNVQRFITDSEKYHRVDIGQKLLSAGKFSTGLKEVEAIVALRKLPQ